MVTEAAALLGLAVACYDMTGGLIAGGVWGCSTGGAVREILPRRRGIGGIVAHADGGWDGGGVRDFCRSPRGSADGLATDTEGGVWLALGEGAGIARFLPDGALDQLMTLPPHFVSSLCFGGADMRDVLIRTADNEVHPELGGTLLWARSEVAGLPLMPVSV